jgi:hypothetical protein
MRRSDTWCKIQLSAGQFAGSPRISTKPRNDPMAKRELLTVAMALAFSVAPLSKNVRAQHTPSTPAAIASWIADLDSRDYKTREFATKSLEAAGAASLDQLLDVANGNRPEAAERAIWVLRQMTKSSDLQLAVPALERLLMLKDRGDVVAKAAEQLANIRHQQAVDAIVKLGGRLAPVRALLTDPRLAPIQVVLDTNWKGGEDGITLLQNIRGLVRVAIIGTDLSMKELAKLEAVRGLQVISLYGTHVTNADVNELRKLIPNVTVDVRKGGLLGIKGDNATEGAAHVREVQADGAAEKAGIRAGDNITHLNTEELANFQALVDRVANMPPGDVVSLRINRNGRVIDVDVRLGQWNADDVLKN